MIFWAYFSKNVTNPAFNLFAFRRKTLFEWNFWENFPKNYKKCAQKIAKNGFLSIFFKQFHNHSIQFLRVWMKRAICRKFFRKFSKNYKKCVKKIAKNWFLSICIEKVNKPSIQFLRVWTKNTFFGNFQKILKRFRKKIAKNSLFTLAPVGIFRGGKRGPPWEVL